MKSKKGIASVLANIWGSHREEHPCPHCGSGPRSGLISFIELAGSVICGCVLLCVLVTACFLVTQWIDNVEHNFFHQFPWHEPLDDWML
jgi:hypothetical protein